MSSYLNIAQICPATFELGPGKRYVVWVQGCPFKCSGCIAPEWIPIRESTIIPVQSLAKKIQSDEGFDELEGLTISGGEPMLQANAVADLIEILHKAKPGFSTIIFSGFTLDQLSARSEYDRGIKRLLDVIDVLVDGLYVERLNNDMGLRGSSNQRIHFLTDRYLNECDYFEHRSRAIEIHILKKELLAVGIPDRETTAAFDRSIVALRGLEHENQR